MYFSENMIPLKKKIRNRKFISRHPADLIRDLPNLPDSPSDVKLAVIVIWGNLDVFSLPTLRKDFKIFQLFLVVNYGLFLNEEGD